MVKTIIITYGKCYWNVPASCSRVVVANIYDLLNNGLTVAQNKVPKFKNEWNMEKGVLLFCNIQMPTALPKKLSRECVADALKSAWR